MADGIRDVQDAEEKARLIVEAAKREKAARIQEAESKTKKIIDEAEADSDALEKETLKKTDSDIIQLRSKIISQAKDRAALLKKKKPTQEMLVSMAQQAIKEIMGE